MRDLSADDTLVHHRRRAIGARAREERMREQVILAARIDRVTSWGLESGDEALLSTLIRVAWVMEIPPATLME
ncbi:XRE family transcriptional regulator [Streptomyces sp. NPDC017988]|uniref:XRE family transcriptional regulator n=1 Tax=Streptomyces sp. NPDC017988 TaxID=3365025 RepID=UPI0037A190F7